MHRYPHGVGLRRRDLLAGEEVIVEVRSDRSALVGPATVVLLLLGAATGAVLWLHVGSRAQRLGVGAIPVVVAVLWLCLRWLTWRSRVVAVTSERVLVVEGVLRRRTDQVRLSRIVEVHLVQGALQRMLRRGAVVVDLDDGSQVLIDGLRRPDAFARLLLRRVVADEGPPGGLGSVPVVVSEDDPTPPRGIPAVTAPAAAAALIRRDEVDRLEAEGALSPEEAARRRAELGWA